MPRITIENCKAPMWDEFDKLKKVGAAALFEQAESVKAEIKRLEQQLTTIGFKIQAKLDVAVDPHVKSVRFGSLLVTRRESYVRRSLDKEWAMKKLIAKGVKKAEIDSHMKETEIEAGVSLQLLGSSEDEGEE